MITKIITLHCREPFHIDYEILKAEVKKPFYQQKFKHNWKRRK
jgi:hypothetical protein